MAEKEEEKEKKNQRIPFLEWLTAAIGLILVVGAIGFIIYKAATNEQKPPILKVSYGAVEKNEAGYLVKFEVENSGDETAAAVVIEGKLTKGVSEVETSSATFDYAPSHSKRNGGLYFKNNPKEFDFEIFPKGYQKP